MKETMPKPTVKKRLKKQAAVAGLAKDGTVSNHANGGPDAEAREWALECMIREAAYYRAEQRNFTDGDCLADWLAAQADISRLLSNGAETEQRSP